MNIEQFIKNILNVNSNFSDIHLSTDKPPLIRVDGDLISLQLPTIRIEDISSLCETMLNKIQHRDFIEYGDIDLAWQLDENHRFRVNIFKQLHGIGVVFRRIPMHILTLEELGLPKILTDLTQYEKGLILVTGATGSGKSTTLAAMLNEINERRQAHIVTIEDPIEFVHSSKKCLINQREIGTHVKSFPRALRAVLREDPDVILVGEMRDLETIHLALTAAETGHLVLATLHTSSATKTIDRIIDVFSPEQQAQIRTMLAASLRAVISQTLCKKIEGGRVAAFEILISTPAVKNLIRELKSFQIPSVIQTSKVLGMQTLEMHLKNLVSHGIITQETANQKIDN